MLIHAAVIENKSGFGVYVARTKQELMAQVADYCEQFWNECPAAKEIPEPPTDNAECVRLYFDENEQEWLDFCDTVTLGGRGTRSVRPEPARKEVCDATAS